MNEHVRFERSGDIEWIIFNNPAKLNCLSREMIRQINAHLRSLREDEQVAAVIFTGSGEKAFCAGVNVNEFKGLNPHTARELMAELKELCELARNLPQAVIMAINGYCIGGAMELAMAADIRIASKNAVFGMPEIKLGIPSVLDSVLLQQHVGLSLAKEMLLTGDSVDVERINQYGFINQVVELSELKSAAENFAKRITSNARETVAMQKQLFETWQNCTLDMAIQDSVNQFALSFTTDVPQKRLEMFLSSKKQTS
jgi:enoyl-CoA hydratase